MQIELVLANGQTFSAPGKIGAIEADFNNETGNIAFRAGFDNPKGLLRHGETGKVMMTAPYPNALLIPQKATFEVLDRRFVFVVDEQGFVKTRPISVAAEIPNIFIVDGGLEETDHILLDGIRKVRDGDQIEVEYQQPAEVLSHLDLHAE
jgi:membrane fusion protein (multidrug efflux system)